MYIRHQVLSCVYEYAANHHIKKNPQAFFSVQGNHACRILFAGAWFAEKIICHSLASISFSTLPTVFSNYTRFPKSLKNQNRITMPTPIIGAVDSLKASFKTTMSKQSAIRVLRFLSQQSHIAQRLLGRFFPIGQFYSPGYLFLPFTSNL